MTKTMINFDEIKDLVSMLIDDHINMLINLTEPDSSMAKFEIVLRGLYIQDRTAAVALASIFDLILDHDDIMNQCIDAVHEVLQYDYTDDDFKKTVLDLSHSIDDVLMYS